MNNVQKDKALEEDTKFLVYMNKVKYELRDFYSQGQEASHNEPTTGLHSFHDLLFIPLWSVS